MASIRGLSLGIGLSFGLLVEALKRVCKAISVLVRVRVRVTVRVTVTVRVNHSRLLKGVARLEQGQCRVNSEVSYGHRDHPSCFTIEPEP